MECKQKKFSKNAKTRKSFERFLFTGFEIINFSRFFMPNFNGIQYLVILLHGSMVRDQLVEKVI